MTERRYKVIKTDEDDYAIVYTDDEGETIPQAMSIMDIGIANKLCRHLNADRWVNTMYRERKRDDAFVRTPCGFHMKFANGRGVSVQWGLGSYCDGGTDVRPPLSYFKVQVQDEGVREMMPEFDDDMHVEYEQMYRMWGSPDAETSPAINGCDVSGNVSPEDVARLLYEISQEGVVIENPIETLKKVCDQNVPSDDELLESVEKWRGGDRGNRPHVHEWRNYLDEICNKEIWEKLTPLGRAVVYVICEGQADREEWD